MDYKLKDTLMRPALTGLIGGGLTYAMFDGSIPVLIADYNVPSYVVVGLTLAGAELVGGLGGNYLLPMIESPENAYYTRMLTQPALTGLANNLGLYLMDKSDLPNMKAVLLGAGASLASGYIEQTFIKRP